MKSILRFLLAVILLAFSGNILSQDIAEELDRVYGLDPLLYNGKKYTYFLPSGTGGHQFLLSPDYFMGGVTIKGQHFKNITLNYDIFNQQLLLKYTDEKGAFNIIEISKAWLENFSLGNSNFTYQDLGEGKRFYQVLGDRTIKILFYWRKDLKLGVGATSSEFVFTPAMRSTYILVEGKLKEYRSKKSFIKLFDASLKREIKNYMRKNRIRLKKASDRSMAELINYIDSIRVNE